MADEYTEITEESWGGRLGRSIKGILFGLLAIGGSVVLLFWNEGRSVRRAKALEEGIHAVVHVNSDEIRAENEGKLVHFTAKAETKDWLGDRVCGIRVNAIALRRDVQMYQWEEDKETRTKKSIGGKKRRITTYRYRKVWSDSLIDSSSFKKQEGHKNPARMRVQGQSIFAKNVYAGAFLLPEFLVKELSPTESLQLTQEHANQLKAYLNGNGTVHILDGGKMLYVGNDPAQPQVGDLKISYSKLTSAIVSVIGKQQGNTIVPYQTKSGDSLALLYTGQKSADEMFKAEQAKNSMITWILRLVGFVIMGVGIYALFYPFVVLMDVIPFLGDVTGCLLGVIAFLLAACGSLVVIAAGWIYYRPLLGGLLLGGAAAILVLLGTLLASRRKTRKDQAYP